jgi:hypothetical protein
MKNKNSWAIQRGTLNMQLKRISHVFLNLLNLFVYALLVESTPIQDDYIGDAGELAPTANIVRVSAATIRHRGPSSRPTLQLIKRSKDSDSDPIGIHSGTMYTPQDLRSIKYLWKGISPVVDHWFPNNNFRRAYR